MKLYENFCFSHILLWGRYGFHDNMFQSPGNKVNSKQIVASSLSGRKVKQKANLWSVRLSQTANLPNIFGLM